MAGPSWIDWGFLMEEMDHEEWANFFSRLSEEEQRRFYYETHLTSENWDEFWENFDEERFVERGIRQGHTREQIVEMIEYSRQIKPLSKEEFERQADEALKALHNDPEFQEELRKRLEARKANKRKALMEESADQ